MIDRRIGLAAEQRAEPWILMDSGEWTAPPTSDPSSILGPDFDDYCFPMDDRMHDGSGWAAGSGRGSGL